jgi:outer membrane protein assembly factor BamE (lipoprotein component of BamABCDE complex)
MKRTVYSGLALLAILLTTACSNDSTLDEGDLLVDEIATHEGYAGDSVQIEATSPYYIVYQASNTYVAGVSDYGMIYFNTVGSDTIYVKSKGRVEMIRITVLPRYKNTLDEPSDALLKTTATVKQVRAALGKPTYEGYMTTDNEENKSFYYLEYAKTGKTAFVSYHFKMTDADGTTATQNTDNYHLYRALVSVRSGYSKEAEHYLDERYWYLDHNNYGWFYYNSNLKKGATKYVYCRNYTNDDGSLFIYYYPYTYEE